MRSNKSTFHETEVALLPSFVVFKIAFSSWKWVNFFFFFLLKVRNLMSAVEEFFAEDLEKNFGKMNWEFPPRPSHSTDAVSSAHYKYIFWSLKFFTTGVEMEYEYRNFVRTNWKRPFAGRVRTSEALSTSLRVQTIIFVCEVFRFHFILRNVENFDLHSFLTSLPSL